MRLALPRGPSAAPRSRVKCPGLRISASRTWGTAWAHIPALQRGVVKPMPMVSFELQHSSGRVAACRAVVPARSLCRRPTAFRVAVRLAAADGVPSCEYEHEQPSQLQRHIVSAHFLPGSELGLRASMPSATLLAPALRRGLEVVGLGPSAAPSRASSRRRSRGRSGARRTSRARIWSRRGWRAASIPRGRQQAGRQEEADEGAAGEPRFVVSCLEVFLAAPAGPSYINVGGAVRLYDEDRLGRDWDDAGAGARPTQI